MMVFQALRWAYNVDVDPILAKARIEAGGVVEIIATYRACRWRERKAQKRKPVGAPRRQGPNGLEYMGVGR